MDRKWEPVLPAEPLPLLLLWAKAMRHYVSSDEQQQFANCRMYIVESQSSELRYSTAVKAFE